MKKKTVLILLIITFFTIVGGAFAVYKFTDILDFSNSKNNYDYSFLNDYNISQSDLSVSGLFLEKYSDYTQVLLYNRNNATFDVVNLEFDPVYQFTGDFFQISSQEYFIVDIDTDENIWNVRDVGSIVADYIKELEVVGDDYYVISEDEELGDKYFDLYNFIRLKVALLKHYENTGMTESFNSVMDELDEFFSKVVENKLTFVNAINRNDIEYISLNNPDLFEESNCALNTQVDYAYQDILSRLEYEDFDKATIGSGLFDSQINALVQAKNSLGDTKCDYISQENFEKYKQTFDLYYSKLNEKYELDYEGMYILSMFVNVRDPLLIEHFINVYEDKDLFLEQTLLLNISSCSDCLEYMVNIINYYYE